MGHNPPVSDHAHCPQLFPIVPLGGTSQVGDLRCVTLLDALREAASGLLDRARLLPNTWFFLAFGEEVRQAVNREDPVDH